MKADRLGITITLIVIFWTLVLFVPLLQQPTEKQVEKVRPSNMDFVNCKLSTFKPIAMPFVIKLFHEPVKSAEFFEVHENPDTIFASQQTNVAMMFWSHDPDNRYIQVSIEYAEHKPHKVWMEYESGEQNSNEAYFHNTTKWCKIFELQKDQTVKDGNK